MIRGIGVDAVDIERFRTSLGRTPSMRGRLFTEQELADVAEQVDQVRAFGFHEVWVSRSTSGAPLLHVTGRAAELAVDRGITSWHLSLTHTDLVAIAYVVAE